MNIRNTCCALFLLFLGFACREEDASPVDRLDPTGMPGEWVYQNTSVNGIMDLTAPLNDHFMTLEPDENPDDLKGRFHSHSPWHSNSGTFELREAVQELVMRYDNKERTFRYTLPGEDDLCLTRVEEGNIIEDYWKRME